MKLEKYIFTYRSGPNCQRVKAVAKRFKNQSGADAFKTGLRIGGAVEVNYQLVNR